MRENNYLQAIYKSFYSRELYRDVAMNWGGGVVLYLFILLVISWLVFSFRAETSIVTSFKLMAVKIAPQLPEIKVKNGLLTTPEQRPYLINDPDTGTLIAVIDDSGKYKTLEDAPKGTKILLTHDSVYFFNDNDNSVKAQKLPDNLNLDVTSEQAKKVLAIFGEWIWFFMLPILLLSSFVYRLIQAVIYAVLGKIFAVISGNPIEYSKILKLSLVAVTPAIVVSTVLTTAGIWFPFEGLVLFIISMIYLIFAIGANK